MSHYRPQQSFRVHAATRSEAQRLGLDEARRRGLVDADVRRVVFVQFDRWQVLVSYQGTTNRKDGE